MKQEKVAIIGSGNWGTAIAKVVGMNILENPKLKNYQKIVDMWVFEEILPTGDKLSETINKVRENVKYLPYITLPKNIYANPSIEDTIKDATTLIFVLPHQFLGKILEEIKKIIEPSKLKSLNIISLIKGIYTEDNKVKVSSQTIANQLKISHKNVAVLSGGNIATDIAREEFATTTISCKNKKVAQHFAELFQNKNFKVETRSETIATEYYGALKNILALARGFAEALHLSPSTKAGIIMQGVQEMRQFLKDQKVKYEEDLFFESCGIADLLVTMESGRNSKFAQKYVMYNKDQYTQSKEFIENKYFNGQKIQGTHTLETLYQVLIDQKIVHKYPLLSQLYMILYKRQPASSLLDYRNKPKKDLKKQVKEKKDKKKSKKDLKKE